MAYNILKLHSKTLIKMDMDLIVEFFQKTLPSSFGFEDDFVIDSLRESVEELSSLQLDTRAHEKTSSQSKQSSHSHSSHGDLTSSHQQEPAKHVSNSIPVVKVSHSNTEVSDSDDEPIVTADAELSVIIEDPDESIISSRSICSSRDDLSSSFDFYEVRSIVERMMNRIHVMLTIAGPGVDRDGPPQHPRLETGHQQAPLAAQGCGGQERCHDVPAQTQAALREETRRKRENQVQSEFRQKSSNTKPRNC